MINTLTHVSIVVPDIEAAARQLSERYGIAAGAGMVAPQQGLAVGARMVNTEQGVRLAYVELAGARIELMEPTRADSPVAKFLERNPRGGIHHFCVGVDSVDTTRTELASKGAQV